MTLTLRALLLAALIAALMTVSPQLQAQTQMIVQIEANGEIITDGEGGGTLGGVDTQDYAFALNYGWVGEANLDATSGLPTGRSNYRPLSIVKPLARSSVLLRKALDERQDIGLALRLFAPDGMGGVAEVYRIDLTNGIVVGIRPFTDGATGQYLEEIRVAYASLEFTDVQTGTSHVIQNTTNP